MLGNDVITYQKGLNNLKIFNKLVRDKIPQIIYANGEYCDIHVLDDAEYEAALKTKLQEELNEFLEASELQEQIEELADLLEVVYSFAQSKGVELHELETIRKQKYDERGGFQERQMLLSTFQK